MTPSTGHPAGRNTLPPGIPPRLEGPDLSDVTFEHFRRFIYQAAGITLTVGKKTLVVGRLARRLRDCGVDSFEAYLARLQRDADERQQAIDLLTTNETYFFREPPHFRFLTRQILPTVHPGREFRVWSAACSSGEEPYSIAMVLAEHLGSGPWQVLGSDLSSRMLDTARRGQYPMARTRDIPRPYLVSHCLKGVGPQEGTFRIKGTLRQRLRLEQINLNRPLPTGLGQFDVVFLRNVLIYFDLPTKRRVVERVAALLRPGGHLLVGHAEGLSAAGLGLVTVQPSIYRRP